MATVTITSFTIPDWQYGGTTAKLRLYSNVNWSDSDGLPHLRGSVGSRTGFFQEISCTVSSTTVTVPTFTLPSTSDAVSPANASGILITGVLFDSHGVRREPLFSSWQIPTTTPTTFEALTILNGAKTLPQAPDYYLNATQVQNLIDAEFTGLLDASDVIKGRTYLDYAPDSATSPRAVSATSPVVGRNSDDYASLAAAVTAIGSTPTTLVITNSFASGGSTTVPSTLTLKFVRGGSIVLGSGHTVTIQGPIQASPVQIFSGSGLVRFTDNVSIHRIYAAWWGVKASATDNAAVLQAASDAIPNTNFQSIVFELPPEGTLKIASTVQFKNLEGVTVEGNRSYIKWTGALGGTMISVNRVKSSIFQNMNLDTNSNPAISANIAFDIDQTVSGTPITSNDIFRNMSVINYGSSSFVGFAISRTQTQNCEAIQIDHVDIVGNGAGTGVYIYSPNAKNISFNNGSLSYLTYGIRNHLGNFSAWHNLSTDCDAIFYVDGNYDPITISEQMDETSTRILLGNNIGQVTLPITIRDSHFQPDNDGSTYLIELGGIQTNLTFTNNSFDGDSALKVFGGNTSSALVEYNNTYPNTDETKINRASFGSIFGTGSQLGGQPLVVGGVNPDSSRMGISGIDGSNNIKILMRLNNSTQAQVSESGVNVNVEGSLRAYSGTAGSPSYSFKSSSTEGLFLIASQRIGLAIASLPVYEWNDSEYKLRGINFLSFGDGSTNNVATEPTNVSIKRAGNGLLEIDSGTLGQFRDLKVRQPYVDATLTAGGTTGAQTINKAAGSVNFAAAATSLVVTNSLVTANSIVICTIQTHDATLTSVQAVPTSGSFTIYANAAATAETKVGFLVVNQ